MATDLIQIRGPSTEAEYRDFRRYLSAHHHRIDAFQRLAVEVQRETDCRQCANCCRYSIVEVDRQDIVIIAGSLDMDAGRAEELYTTADSDSQGRILRSTPEGCVFLSGNLCTIYAARPKACRDFPHVAPGVRSLGARLSSVCRWAPMCPIIDTALERCKHLIGYHEKKRTGPH